MSLAKSYCKEIIKQLDKIPVFLPGTPVEVGDVITFGEHLLKPKPIGSFKHVTKLSKLGIELETQTDTEGDPYLYASKKSVSVKFEADATANIAGKGKLDIKFNKEGATYFAGVDCELTKAVDISNLRNDLEPHKHKIDWKNCFIVSSVTVAKKALIMQSNSSSASLSIEGNVGGLQIGSKTEADASALLSVSGFQDYAFIKDWSDNVTVFFTLVRYKKKIFGDWDVKMKSRALINDKDDEYDLTFIEAADLF